MNDLILAYNEIIKEKFPTITCIAGYDDQIFALNVSEDISPSFARFILNGLGDALRARGLAFIGVVPFSPQATKIKFPSLGEVLV